MFKVALASCLLFIVHVLKILLFFMLLLIEKFHNKIFMQMKVRWCITHNNAIEKGQKARWAIVEIAPRGQLFHSYYF